MRPLLEIPKARLIATLARAGIEFADDPSNRDPRFTRARLREMMCALAREGLDARRLSLLARRLRRAEAAIETAVDVAMAALSEAAVAGSRADRVRCRPIRSPARGGRPAAARPRDCTHRRRGIGPARQARDTLRGAADAKAPARQRAGDVPWRARWSPCAEPSWRSSVPRPGADGPRAVRPARFRSGHGWRAPPPEGRRTVKGTVKGIELVPLAGAPPAPRL